MMVNGGEDVQTDYNYLIFSINFNVIVIQLLLIQLI